MDIIILSIISIDTIIIIITITVTTIISPKMRRPSVLLLCVFSIACVKAVHGQEEKEKRFLCTVIPVDKDPSCPVQTEFVQSVQSEGLKKTVMQLRVTVLQQEETITQQLGAIKELTSKLSQCESTSEESSSWRNGKDTMDDVPRDPSETLDALGKTMQSLKDRLQNLEVRWTAPTPKHKYTH